MSTLTNYRGPPIPQRKEDVVPLDELNKGWEQLVRVPWPVPWPKVGEFRLKLDPIGTVCNNWARKGQAKTLLLPEMISLVERYSGKTMTLILLKEVKVQNERGVVLDIRETFGRRQMGCTTIYSNDYILGFKRLVTYDLRNYSISTSFSIDQQLKEWEVKTRGWVVGIPGALRAIVKLVHKSFNPRSWRDKEKCPCEILHDNQRKHFWLYFYVKDEAILKVRFIPFPKNKEKRFSYNEASVRLYQTADDMKDMGFDFSDFTYCDPDKYKDPDKYHAKQND